MTFFSDKPCYVDCLAYLNHVESQSTIQIKLNGQ